MIEYFWFLLSIISGFFAIHYFAEVLIPRSYPESDLMLLNYYNSFTITSEIKSCEESK